LWLVWLLVQIFVLQNAIASAAEMQSTAQIIFWVVFAVLLIGGVVVWIIRRPQSE
jgi:hypothetical protein